MSGEQTSNTAQINSSGKIYIMLCMNSRCHVDNDIRTGAHLMDRSVGLTKVDARVVDGEVQVRAG